jgi:hypothetical protein
MQHTNRLSPAGQPADYKTYAIASPIETHTRAATCQEVECLAYQNGWITEIDVSTTLGQNQAAYIQHRSGRSYSVEQNGSQVKLTFPAGQECFHPHRVALDRPAIFVVRDGDWRGNPRGTSPVIRTPDDWVDDFANHQISVANQIERG